MTTPADAILIGFARSLQAAGVAVTPDREVSYLQAVSVVGLDDRDGTYWAGRATLCSGPDDFARYDRVFEAWFNRGRADDGERGHTKVRHASASDLLGLGMGEADDATAAVVIRAGASEQEVLRHRDIATLTQAEKLMLATMFGSLKRPAPLRRTGRMLPARRGGIDVRRTMRAQFAHLGEPVDLRRRHRSERARRIVLLIDVSGSMRDYSDALLRLAHHWIGGGRPVEVFTLGTRLTRVTRALHQRDAEAALAAAGDTVPDWSGGTRLGESLKAFLDRWGQRGMARGAVVVVCSDGWERHDTALLAEQLGRLKVLAHRVVWVNPHSGKSGYLPIQAGIVAALPHLDELVAGHSLRTFDALAEVIDRA